MNSYLSYLYFNEFPIQLIQLFNSKAELRIQIHIDSFTVIQPPIFVFHYSCTHEFSVGYSSEFPFIYFFKRWTLVPKYAYKFFRQNVRLPLFDLDYVTWYRTDGTTVNIQLLLTMTAASQSKVFSSQAGYISSKYYYFIHEILERG